MLCDNSMFRWSSNWFTLDLVYSSTGLVIPTVHACNFVFDYVVIEIVTSNGKQMSYKILSYDKVCVGKNYFTLRNSWSYQRHIESKITC